MARRPLKFTIGVLLLIIAVGAIAFTVLNLRDAYGNGPPYYGSTTNMDNWENPLPVLVPVDVGVIVLIGIYAVWLRRTR
ncbi:hypothetical protein [Burkholderia glumae]|uniref:hypothetical protein n=1 Tax=Burkholderia glumae TaxID=337 RepID=UPI00054ADEDE|nr:hypothetical protein [Burkholderia glumae]KHJ63936.1 hypothetical protein NCPPB3923_05580 [Burkholderia glumae]